MSDNDTFIWIAFGSWCVVMTVFFVGCLVMKKMPVLFVVSLGLLMLWVLETVAFQVGAEWQRGDTLSKYKLTPLNQPAP
jgi:hypothetical protein